MMESIPLHSSSSCDFPRRLHAARRGSPVAQDALFRHYHRQIERMAHAQLVQGRRANGMNFAARFSTADIVQEVFQTLLRNLDSFQGTTEGEFVTYVAKVVRSRVLDSIRFHGASCRDLRRSRGHVDEEILGDRAGGEAAGRSTGDDGDLKARYQAELSALPEESQELIRARIERRLGFEAIARELGYSSRYAARRAFFSAQARLVLRLKPE